MSNYRWAGLPEPNDLEFNAKVKEVIETLVSRRGQGVLVLPGGIQEAVDLAGRQATDAAIDATTLYIAEEETAGTEIVFKNVFDPTTYAGYEFSFLAVRPVSTAIFVSEVSTDSGVTWDVTGSYPRFSTEFNLTLGTKADTTNAAGTSFRFSTGGGVGTTAARALTGWARLMIPPSPASVVQMVSKTQHSDGTNFFATEGRMYYTQTTALVNAIRFHFGGSPNFAGGNILMRGIRRL